MPDLITQQIAQKLHGATATDADISLLRSSFDPRLIPNWLLITLQENRLAGVFFR